VGRDRLPNTRDRSLSHRPKASSIGRRPLPGPNHAWQP